MSWYSILDWSIRFGWPLQVLGFPIKAKALATLTLVKTIIDFHQRDIASIFLSDFQEKYYKQALSQFRRAGKSNQPEFELTQAIDNLDMALRLMHDEEKATFKFSLVPPFRPRYLYARIFFNFRRKILSGLFLRTLCYGLRREDQLLEEASELLRRYFLEQYSMACLLGHRIGLTPLLAERSAEKHMAEHYQEFNNFYKSMRFPKSVEIGNFSVGSLWNTINQNMVPGPYSAGRVEYYPGVLKPWDDLFDGH